LFQGFTTKQIEQATHLMRTRAVAAGEHILSEGEIGGEMFILLKGAIEISKHMTLLSRVGEGHLDKSLIRLKDSDNVFFGEMSLFDSDKRSATVTAVTDTVVASLTREQVHILCERDAEIGFKLFYNIGQTLAENLRHAHRDILKLATAFCLALEGK